VESWVNGASWRELCRDTSLDQGDVCRMLRRTVEVLRQVSRDSIGSADK
jgi:superfamily II RNA helicase